MSATVDELNLPRFCVTTLPAVENVLSDGADVAGMQRKRLAKALNRGKIFQ